MRGVKKIKEIITRLYYGAMLDGMDYLKLRNDRFYGNSTARIEWEKEIIERTMNDIKNILKEKKV